MADESPRKMMPAETLSDLVALCGSGAEAGRRIGCSGAAVNRWITDNAVPLGYHLAALHVLGDAVPTRVYICRVRDEKKSAALYNFLEALEIPFSLETF